MTTIYHHSVPIGELKALLPCIKDIYEQVTYDGRYYLSASVTLGDLSLNIFSEMYKEPIDAPGIKLERKWKNEKQDL